MVHTQDTEDEAMAKAKKKAVDDEKDRHPFYSSVGIKIWKLRLKELEIQEKELAKRRKSKNDDIQEAAPKEDRES